MSTEILHSNFIKVEFSLPVHYGFSEFKISYQNDIAQTFLITPVIYYYCLRRFVYISYNHGKVWTYNFRYVFVYT